KLRKAVTDPLKVRKNDPGRPEVCLVFSYHKKFSPSEILEIETGCRSGALGCVDCKLKCTSNISSFIAPILEKRKYYEEHLDEVKDILTDGENRAQKVAKITIQEVRDKMRLG
ncbi:MAG: tryptophan--tRNA ligase, partial [Ignavibacteria bacterium CG_4_8_14_3_um_filter_37_9]